MSRARAAMAALALGSIAACLGAAACSVNQAGLSKGDASASTTGAGGGVGKGGSGGGSAGATGGASFVTGTAGGGAPGVGGSSLGGSGVGGSGISTGGSAGGQGGSTVATGGTGVGGGGPSGGAGATGGSGTAGSGVGGSGPGGGFGGAGASGGSGVGGGNGGAGGGSGGGAGHSPNCSAFKTGASFITPTDGQLHCYWAHPELLGGDAAEAICENEGGTLATILSVEENTFVELFAQQAGLFSLMITIDPFGPSVSLGATDGRSDSDKSGAGTYAWVTGEPWIYHNWHQGQPDGSCNPCSSSGNGNGNGNGGGGGVCCDHWLTMTPDAFWRDRPESGGRPFVCEAKARPSP